MNPWLRSGLMVGGVLVLSLLAGCGDGDGQMYKCVYEMRVTSSTCATASDWAAQCIEFNEDDITVSPQQKCDLVSGGTTCTPSGSCCNSTEVRKIQLEPGTC